MSVSALVLGCAGTALDRQERAFFRDCDPWGFILFRRNIDNPTQVSRLTQQLREAVGREALIFVDQEGGRVQRLTLPHWPKYPSGRSYGRLYAEAPLARREITRLGARLIAHDLKAVGIDGDCLPVLDVPFPGSHDVIGDRAYAEDPETVAILGRAAAEGLLSGGVLPVMKHAPGHGRAGVDSHLSLPVVEASHANLAARDFLPFRHLSDLPAAMTAHVVYKSLDAKAPATTSRRVIRNVIRREIGFDGLLLSDDLSMRALSEDIGANTRDALTAGCDMGLHCNGKPEEMDAVAANAVTLSGKAKRRAEAAMQRIRHLPEPLDVEDARARLAEALATLA